MSLKKRAISFIGALMIANILIPSVAACTVGLTPGYWKNIKHEWPEEFERTNTLGEVFGLTGKWATITLDEALRFKGGRDIDGARRILLRACVAMLLSQHYFDQSQQDKDYAYKVVNDNWDKPRWKIIKVAAKIDGFNNLGPP